MALELTGAEQLGKLRFRARTPRLQRLPRKGRVLPGGPPPSAPHAGVSPPAFSLAKPPPRMRAMVATVAAAWLLLWATACAKSEQDFYDFKAVNIRGKLVSLEKYRGSVSDGPLRAWLAGGRGVDGGARPRASLGDNPLGCVTARTPPWGSQPSDQSTQRPQAHAHLGRRLRGTARESQALSVLWGS